MSSKHVKFIHAILIALCSIFVAILPYACKWITMMPQSAYRTFSIIFFVVAIIAAIICLCVRKKKDGEESSNQYWQWPIYSLILGVSFLSLTFIYPSIRYDELQTYSFEGRMNQLDSLRFRADQGDLDAMLQLSEDLIQPLPIDPFTNDLSLVDYREAEKYLQQIGVHRKPSTLVSELSISEKQEVEIAKALSAQAKIVIMDEPTSSLSIDETENLFRIIRKLKEQNIAIIYISHKLQEIKQIGDRVTVMKDGKYVKTVNVADIETRDLVPLMIGREVKNSYLNENTAGFSGQPAIFEVRNLTRKDGSCNNISFQVHTGEILGFSGLIGAGRSECMEGIFGARPISSGEVFLRGKKLRIRNPYDAMKKGIAFVTENRRETGFFPNFQIWKEIAVSTSLKRSTAGGFSGLVQEDRERKTAGEYVKRLNIKCTGPDQMTYTLSGGNQQKVIVSKWLAADSDVMIFDEPTKGIDVGAKSEIYAIMRNLADEGKAILMVSSELPELLSICDRIIVFRDGSISGEFLNKDATEEKLMMAAVDA